MASSDPKEALFHHVMDSETIEIFSYLRGERGVHHLPSIDIFGYHFKFTKYMLMELIAAILIIAIYVPLARRLAKGDAPKGAWWNVWEGLLTFVRDFVARPSLRAAEGNGHGHGHWRGHSARRNGEL